MAFDPTQFIGDYKKRTSSQRTTFDPQKFIEEFKTKTVPTRVFTPQSQLKTERGLVSTAERVGVGEKAKSILAEKGEDPERIFSGGFTSDVFDSMNLLQHGVVGMLQGKGFVDGVKTRASFTKEKELKDAGVLGTVVGIALDIAVDPLTYIAPWSVLKRIPGLTKGAKAVGEAVTKTRIGEKLASSVVYRFGQDPIYRALDERRLMSIGKTNRLVKELSDDLRKIDPEIRKTLTTRNEKGQTIRKPIEQLQKEGVITEDVLGKIGKMYDMVDGYTKQYVELGALPKDVYKNIGKYLKNSFTEYETGKKAKTFFGVKPSRVDISSFKARKDIPDEVREALGQIDDLGYLLPDTLMKMNKNIENLKFFNDVAKKFGSDVTQDGFTKLATSKSLGALAGKSVPKPIADSINEIVEPVSESLARKFVAGFKFGKVILNPSTHARNIVSNILLNSFEGMNPLDPRSIKAYGLAAKELKTQGKWYKEALEQGLGVDTYAAREIKDILLNTPTELLGKSKKLMSETVDKLSNIYQKEEEWAKLSQYIFQRNKGVSPEEAWKIAERATFNYSQVTPFIRKLRENAFGVPFITFTYKATPQVAKTIAKKPTRISNIGKIKEGIENSIGIDQEERARERAAEPSWIRDGFYVKLPFKDERGRSAYFDLTYIIPFGDLVSGQFIQPRISRETGLEESLPETLVEKSPAMNLIKELVTNQDFFGNKIFKESDSPEQKSKDIFRHITKTYLPPLIANQIPGGYRQDGTRYGGSLQRVIGAEMEPAEGGAQTRTLMQELMSYVGLKIQPVDLELMERMSEAEREKAVETILKEAGVVREYKSIYTPRR